MKALVSLTFFDVLAKPLRQRKLIPQDYSVLRGLLFLTVTIFLSFNSYAQNINDDGAAHSIGYNGSYQDYFIPNNPQIVNISFDLNGGDGGYAQVHYYEEIPLLPDIDQTCTSGGGAGARTRASFSIGSGSGQIPHGSTLRFIAGGAGVSAVSTIGLDLFGNGLTYGGGGGGSAILFQAPGSTTWQLLAVAGGGGGAYQGMALGGCVDSENGQGGRSGNSGGSGSGDIDPGSGGSGGNGGDGNEIGGAGGGYLTAGGGVSCVGIPDLNSSVAGEGGPGGNTGGYGGDSDGCFSFPWKNGGFGFGGGGAGSGGGGGGGGYSGGGTGGSTGAGGGGGSYVNGIATSININAGGSTYSPTHGSIVYQVTLNQQPVAICTDTTLYLDENGMVSLPQSGIDNGSYDPEGSLLTYLLSKSTFDCSDVGANSVTLTVTDDLGLTGECTATITVSDTIEPTVLTQDITIYLDEAGLTSITPQDVDNSSFDNCGIASYSLDMEDFDCDDLGANTVELTVTDVNGNVSDNTATVTVLDTISPDIQNVDPSVSSLWPPNHKMHSLSVNISNSDNCSIVSAKIIQVKSNEAVDGKGDGRTIPDWEITGDTTLNLRAERSGKGDGRIYTIIVESTDQSGNTTLDSTSVAVSHDKGSNQLASNGSDQTTISHIKLIDETLTIEKSNGSFDVNITNNPALGGTNFTLSIQSSDHKSPVRLSIFNASGQIVELKKDLLPGQQIAIGFDYSPGLYYARVIQGANQKAVKLIKH